MNRRNAVVAIVLAAAVAAGFASISRAQCTAGSGCVLPITCGLSGQPNAPIPIAIPVPLELRNVQLVNPRQCTLPPPSGTFDSFFDIFVELSFDGGTTWMPATTPARVTQQSVLLPMPAQPVTFDTEMLQLDLMGSLPGNVMLRESPAQSSLGRTEIASQPGGTSSIDSFFDVFFEISIDGGTTWTPPGPPYRIAAVPMGPVAARESTWGGVKSTYRD
jgi:hypothetical protein